MGSAAAHKTTKTAMCSTQFFSKNRAVTRIRHNKVRKRSLVKTIKKHKLSAISLQPFNENIAIAFR